jgi:hypothetical protein
MCGDARRENASKELLPALSRAAGRPAEAPERQRLLCRTRRGSRPVQPGNTQAPPDRESNGSQCEPALLPPALRDRAEPPLPRIDSVEAQLTHVLADGFVVLIERSRRRLSPLF